MGAIVAENCSGHHPYFALTFVDKIGEQRQVVEFKRKAAEEFSDLIFSGDFYLFGRECALKDQHSCKDPSCQHVTKPIKQGQSQPLDSGCLFFANECKRADCKHNLSSAATKDLDRLITTLTITASSR